MSASDKIALVIEEDENTTTKEELQNHCHVDIKTINLPPKPKSNEEGTIDKTERERLEKEEKDKKDLLRSLKFLVFLVVLQFLSFIVYQIPIAIRIIHKNISSSELWETFKPKCWIIFGCSLARSIVWLFIIIMTGNRYFRKHIGGKWRALTLILPLVMELVLIGLLLAGFFNYQDSNTHGKDRAITLLIEYGLPLFFSTLIVSCNIKLMSANYYSDYDRSMMTKTKLTTSEEKILEAIYFNDKRRREERGGALRKFIFFFHFRESPRKISSIEDGKL